MHNAASEQTTAFLCVQERCVVAHATLVASMPAFFEEVTVIAPGECVMGRGQVSCEGEWRALAQSPSHRARLCAAPDSPPEASTERGCRGRPVVNLENNIGTVSCFCHCCDLRTLGASASRAIGYKHRSTAAGTSASTRGKFREQYFTWDTPLASSA